MALSVPDDIPTIVLALGLIASLITTVAMILGRTPSKKQSVYVEAPKRAQMPAWVPVPTANAARERASASARIKAAASVRERGLHLTDVHEVDSVEIDPADCPPFVAYASYDPATSDPAAHDPAGQGSIPMDGYVVQQPAAVTPQEAQVILTHAGQHEPNSVAEVISQWIKADLKNMARRTR